MERSSATRAASIDQSWAIVLAAGNGTRLSSLTRDTSGAAVPKQFCSLDGAQSLIEQTLTRAARVVAAERVTAVVAHSHRRHWEPALKKLAPDNIVIQPQDRGTAIGILLPALRIAARDPNARILILPSDHHVGDEAVLGNAMRCALEDIREHPAGVALLGLEADEPDPELGYIVPRAGSHPRLRHVYRFVEKPPVDEARRLVSEGALWNSFIVVCRIQSLIELLLRVCPEAVHALRAIESHDEAALLRVYRGLPVIDFSRHIATGQEQQLAVMAVPGCGWNDLGTPHRLAQTLARQPQRSTDCAQTARDTLGSWINLADRLALAYPAWRGCVTRVIPALSRCVSRRDRRFFMYGRILVPIDGSETGNLGLNEAIKLAKNQGGRIRLVHIVNELIMSGTEAYGANFTQIIDILRTGGQTILADGESAVRKAGVEVEAALVEAMGGQAGDHIVQQAKQWGADLIVCGTHGRRGLRRLVLGSDAEYIVRHTPAPILLVRSRESISK